MFTKLFMNEKLNSNSIIPLRGKMESIIFENKNIGLQRSIFYSLSISLKPFNYESEPVSTSLELEWINLNTTNWRGLENKEFAFPLNPKAGYIDASIYLSSEHIYVDITKIIFGKISENNIEVQIFGSINFNTSGHKNCKNTKFNIRTTITYEALTLYQDILEPIEKNLKKATEVAQQYVELEDFDPPKISTNKFGVKIISFQVKK